MIIEELKYKVRDIVKGYTDDEENGVRAFSGSLDVRPPYQREFIYSDDKQQKVIETVLKGYPLNVFYWGTTGIVGQFELIDGQQRTLSICRFVKGAYSIKYDGNDCTFQGLPQDAQNSILNYELTIYKCDGTDEEKLAWFETINIASEALTAQELRNAVYTGAWLSDAKRYFSKTNCPAVSFGGDYVKGTPNRQEILETVLKWISNSQGITLTEYMSNHKNDANAEELWNYFQEVIRWVKRVFGTPTKEMKSVQWGTLYNKCHENHYVDENDKIMCYIDGTEGLHTKAELQAEIVRLQEDDEITSAVGIYNYVLTGDEKKLSVRKFPDKIKLKKWKQQGGLCNMCHRPFDISDMTADHITPWSKGGKTIEGNCQVLCVECNSKKSNHKEVANDEKPCINCGKAVKIGMFCQYCGTKN